MVIGLLTLAAIPTVIGVAEGVSQQRQQNEAKSDEKRMSKFNLDAYCESKSSRAREVHGKRVVLRDGKVGNAFGALSYLHLPGLTLGHRFTFPHHPVNLLTSSAHST
jgi:hypothetical protein